MTGFSELSLVSAVRMPYTRGTQSEEQPNSSCPAQCWLLSCICQPLLCPHPTLPVKQRLEPVSKSKLLSHPCCTESSWPIRHLIPFQSHGRAQTFQQKNIVWTRIRGSSLTHYSPNYEAGDTGLGKPSVFYSTLPLAPHFPGYSYPQVVREAHSGGRVDTTSRIHLPLRNRRSPN